MPLKPQHTLTTPTAHWKRKQAVEPLVHGPAESSGDVKQVYLLKQAGLPLLSPILLARVSINLLLILVPGSKEAIANYLLGVGRADCTGPVAEIPLVSWGN